MVIRQGWTAVIVFVLLLATATVHADPLPPPPAYAVSLLVQEPSVSNATLAMQCLSAIAYRICSADSSCQARFYLDYYQPESIRKSTFDYLLHIHLGLPPAFVVPNAPASTVGTLFLGPVWILAQLNSIDPADPVLGLPFLVETDGYFATACASLTTDDSGLALPPPQPLWFNTSLAMASAGRLWWLYSMRQAAFCTENEVFDEELGCICRQGKVCDEVSVAENLYAIAQTSVVVIVVGVITLYQLSVLAEQCRGVAKEAAKNISASNKLTEIVQRTVLVPTAVSPLLAPTVAPPALSPPSSSSSSSSKQISTPITAGPSKRISMPLSGGPSVSDAVMPPPMPGSSASAMAISAEVAAAMSRRPSTMVAVAPPRPPVPVSAKQTLAMSATSSAMSASILPSLPSTAAPAPVFVPSGGGGPSSEYSSFK